jgi:hypothetical protein
MADLLLTAPSPVPYIVGGASLTLYAPSPDITAATGGAWGSLVLEAPSPTLSIRMVSAFGSLTLEAPSPTVSIQGRSLYYGETLILSAPSPELILAKSAATTGSLTLTSPSPTILFGFGITDWPCLVINTDTMLLSKYDNYDFVSFAKLGDTFLALHSDGNIYELGGDTDAGTAIDATFETGQDDMGESKAKRLIGLVAGLRSDGELSYRANRGNLGYGVSVTIPSTSDTLSETVKLETEKLPLSRTIGIEISNVEGSDFSVDHLELVTRVAARRFGG